MERSLDEEYIAVMSDSHDSLENVERAVKIVLERGIRLVVHLGDVISPFTLAKIVSSGLRTIVVLGNNDGEKIGLRRIAERNGSEVHEPPHLLVVSGKKLLLLHGRGSPDETREFVEALAASGYYDAVLYGHTHIIDNRFVKDTLVLNPGELFGRLSGRASFAILNTRTLDTEIVVF